MTAAVTFFAAPPITIGINQRSQRAAWVVAGAPLRLTGAGPGTTASVLFAENAI